MHPYPPASYSPLAPSPSAQADSPINGSFYGGGGAPFARQLAALCVTVLLCTVGTTVIYWVMWTVARALGLSLTIAVEHIDDIDASQHGEMAYYNRTHQNLEAAVSDAYVRWAVVFCAGRDA